VEGNKRKYYCDFVECKSLGTCIIPMSGEDCATLDMISNEERKKFEEWLKSGE